MRALVSVITTLARALLHRERQLAKLFLGPPTSSDVVSNADQADDTSAQRRGAATSSSAATVAARSV